MPRKIESPSLSPLRFILVGGINTVGGLSVIYGLKWTLDVNDVAANLGGYTAGVTVSYVLNARWTFKYRGALVRVAHLYALVIGVAYAANLCTVFLAIYVLGANDYAAHAMGVVPYALLTYVLSRHVVFKTGSQSAMR